MNVLTVSNLSKKFGKFTAVNNISFDLKEGEVLGLLGPNGAGKTTTIDMLLGLTTPTSGTMEFFGLPFEENRVEILKKMNFSAAYINLPLSLNVIENLYTFARLYEVDDYKNKVEKLMEEFKLTNLKNKITDELSSGQLARLYLCKSFVNSPKILLLDEPTAFLDPDIADIVRKLILKKVKSENMSILFTSHNMPEITEICDRVIFLNHGKIIAEDTPESLAQKIEFCKIRLIFKVEKNKVATLLNSYNYKFVYDNKETVITLNEEDIGQLLGRLSLAKMKYSQITIDKPSLEDFFIKIARQKI
jgi:ABC-2 type transport system ATP-binding protein